MRITCFTCVCIRTVFIVNCDGCRNEMKWCYAKKIDCNLFVRIIRRHFFGESDTERWRFFVGVFDDFLDDLILEIDFCIVSGVLCGVVNNPSLSPFTFGAGVVVVVGGGDDDFENGWLLLLSLSFSLELLLPTLLPNIDKSSWLSSWW